MLFRTNPTVAAVTVRTTAVAATAVVIRVKRLGPILIDLILVLLNRFLASIRLESIGLEVLLSLFSEG